MNAFPRTNGALMVQRQIQAVLGKQDMGGSFGPARPRAIGCDGAGGWLIALQARQENLQRLIDIPGAKLESDSLGLEQRYYSDRLLALGLVPMT
jgi:hypothetical protein